MVESEENPMLAGMMTRTLKVSIAVLVVLMGSYVVVLRVAPPPDRLRSQQGARADGPRPALDPGPYPTEYDEVTVTIEIPPLSEFPAPWADNEGCPLTRLTGALGAMVGPGNGCPVLTVKPGSPADNAGIKRLDRLGKPEDCASALSGSFRPGEEARTVEWVVRRPKGGSAEGAGAEGAEPGEPQVNAGGDG